MSPRVYQRKFDWDDAIQRHHAGETVADLAREYNVSWGAVQRVVNPDVRAKMNRRAAEWSQAPVPCIENCGRTITRISAKYHGGRCRACAAVERGTSARDGELLCFNCRAWKPDDEFTHDSSQKYVRRGRSGTCRACQTRARREYRNRHKVPCVNCGSPALPTNEKRTHGGGVPRCRPCYHEWQRLPEQREAQSLKQRERRRKEQTA